MASKKNSKQSELFAGQFQRIDLLGMGLVGEVYRARNKKDASDEDGSVALKILRTGQDASLIKNEALILGQLWREEETLKDGIHSIPRLITADADGLNQRPFIAMEFIRGKQVSQVLRESESGYLEEAVALNIGAQLFRVLNILHEKINKTYSDLKIENFWWLPAEERLKITDWNVLQDRKASFPGKTDPLLQDLFRASVSLYWMLTGELPDFQNELNAERLQHASNWGQISDGVKDLLNKLLREESLKKMGTAYQIKTELDRLLQYWKDDVKVLKGRAKGKSGDRLDAFSILSRRISLPDEEFQQIERDIQESVKQRNDLTRSVALFGAGSYGAAKTLTDEALPHASEPHIFLWWKQVIDLVEKIENLMKKSGRGDKVNHVRDAALKSINAYQTHDYPVAEEYFGEIEIFASEDENIHKAYSELFAVLKVQNLYASGQEKREEIQFADEKKYESIYDKALEYYDEAFSNVGKIAATSLLPDLLSPIYLKNMVATVKNEKKVLNMVKKANISFQNKEIESASKFWREGFKLDIDHPKLVDSVVKAAQENLDMQNITLGRLELAEELLRIIPSVVSNYSLACNSLRKQIQSARLSLLEQIDSHSEKTFTPLAVDKNKPKNIEVPNKAFAGENLSKIDADGVEIKSIQSVEQNLLIQKDSKLERVSILRPAIGSNYRVDSDNYSKSNESPKTIVKTKELKRKKLSGKKNDNNSTRSQVTTDDTEQNANAEKNIYLNNEPHLSAKRQIEGIGKDIIILINNSDLTIDVLTDKIKKLREYLNEIDPNGEISYYNRNWEELGEFENKQKTVDSLWKTAIKTPLDERRSIVDKLNGMGIRGKRGDFKQELYIYILDSVDNAKANQSKKYTYEQIEILASNSYDDDCVKEFLNKEKEDAKNKVIEAINKTDVSPENSPTIHLAFLRKLRRDWPNDNEIVSIIERVKQVVKAKNNKPPKDWLGIDYYFYFANLNPLQWEKKSKDDWRNCFLDPFVQAEFGEKIDELNELVKKINAIVDGRYGELKHVLRQDYSIDDSSSYRPRIEKTIKDFKLNVKLGWTVDQCVGWHKELKAKR